MKNWSKWVSVLAAAGMTFCLLAGCGSQEEPVTDQTETGDAAADIADADDTSESEAVEEEGSADTADEGDTTFIVGFDAEFEPYGYMDENGEYTGFDLDLAAEVCARNGWELVKQPISWDAKDAELASGSIDCIWNGFTINGREDQYTWSVPYVDSSQVIVVRADAGITVFEDLAGKRVGVQADSSALAALEDEANAELTGSFAELVQYADYNTALMDLEAGATEAVAIDIGVAEKQIEARGAGFIMLADKVATEQYGIGFLLGNTELKDQVEGTLLEMVEDGTFMEIAAQYGLEDSVCLGK